MSVVRTIFLQCPSIPHFSNSSYSPNPAAVKFTVSCCSVASPAAVVNGNVERKPSERNEVRLGLPSKGRMATDTLDLLKVMCVSVHTEKYLCCVIHVHTADFIALGFWLGFFFFNRFPHLSFCLFCWRWRIVNCQWGRSIHGSMLQKFLRCVYFLSVQCLDMEMFILQTILCGVFLEQF